MTIKIDPKEVGKVWLVSSAHLAEQDIAIFDDYPDAAFPCELADAENGVYLVNTAGVLEISAADWAFSSSLRKLLQKANRAGIWYILFAPTGALVKGAPVYAE
jgi:hypothetical protein